MSAPIHVRKQNITYRILSSVVVQVLHEDVHAVHSKVIAVFQRRPALLVFSAPAAAVVVSCDAAKASVAVPIIFLAVPGKKRF